MRLHARTQLPLALDREDRHCPVPQAPEGLVQALADLLLEALGAAEPAATLVAAREGGGDEQQDHA